MDPNSSGSDESSVSRRVRHRIERGGRIESYTTDEILCSFALVKHTKKMDLATENYGETGATAKKIVKIAHLIMANNIKLPVYMRIFKATFA